MPRNPQNDIAVALARSAHCALPIGLGQPLIPPLENEPRRFFEIGVARGVPRLSYPVEGEGAEREQAAPVLAGGG